LRWPSLTKDCKQNSFCVWSGMTDTEQSATSRSNEEESQYSKSKLKLNLKQIELE